MHPYIRRYLDYEVDEEGYMHMKGKGNAMTFADNRAGMFVMLSSTGTSWEQMMSAYDVRDWMEKAFDVYKTDLDGNRSGTGNEERARGRLFIKFVALIMRIHIQNVLRKHDDGVLSTKVKKDSVNGMSVEEAILSLNTLMAIGNTGDWRLTAVTKNVRGDLQALRARRAQERTDHPPMIQPIQSADLGFQIMPNIAELEFSFIKEGLFDSYCSAIRLRKE